MSNGSTTWTLTCDANGTRTGRSNGTTDYSYIYSGDQLVYMNADGYLWYFSYDAAGVPIGFVGVLMLSGIKDVDLHNMESALPAFCTIVFMPFTYSIANGIALGLIVYCLIKLLTGKWRDIKPLTVIVSLIFIARYAFITLG